MKHFCGVLLLGYRFRALLAATLLPLDRIVTVSILLHETNEKDIRKHHKNCRPAL